MGSRSNARRSRRRDHRSKIHLRVHPHHRHSSCLDYCSGRAWDFHHGRVHVRCRTYRCLIYAPVRDSGAFLAHSLGVLSCCSDPNPPSPTAQQPVASSASPKVQPGPMGLSPAMFAGAGVGLSGGDSDAGDGQMSPRSQGGDSDSGGQGRRQQQQQQQRQQRQLLQQQQQQQQPVMLRTTSAPGGGMQPHMSQVCLLCTTDFELPNCHVLVTHVVLCGMRCAVCATCRWCSSRN